MPVVALPNSFQFFVGKPLDMEAIIMPDPVVISIELPIPTKYFTQDAIMLEGSHITSYSFCSRPIGV